MTDRSNWPVRKFKLGEEPLIAAEVEAMSVDERLALVPILTLRAWSYVPGFTGIQPMRRDVVIRRKLHDAR